MRCLKSWSRPFSKLDVPIFRFTQARALNVTTHAHSRGEGGGDGGGGGEGGQGAEGGLGGALRG
eukprot:5657074-Pyramimonas_sp.AAC.1